MQAVKKVFCAMMAVLMVALALPVGTVAKAASPVTITGHTAEEITIIEGTNGYRDADGFHYWIYSDDIKATLFLSNSAYVYLEDGYAYISDGYYYPSVSYDQSTPWGIGKHSVNVTIKGYSFDVVVNIIESPYESIEIMSVDTVREYDLNYDGFYSIPGFSYKLNLKAGGYVTGVYGEDNGHGVVIGGNSQSTGNRWTIGGDNYFIVDAPGVSVKVEVELEPSVPFGYFEQDGEIVVTDICVSGETATIPSKIDDKPVTRVWLTGNLNTNAKHLVLPHSVKSLSVSASMFETITLGSGIEKFDAYSVADDYFYEEPILKAVYVSDENPYLSSKDGVLYDKAGTTLKLWPWAKGKTYPVPAGVTDISIIYAYPYEGYSVDYSNSSAFVVEDGIVYNADKTIVFSCDTDKSGEYIMPNSVTQVMPYAFNGCENLTKIVFSDNVTDIVYGTIVGCGSLETVGLPKNLKSIDTRMATNNNFLDFELKDIAAWCGVEFIGDPYGDISPIAYAGSGDVYLNGSLITSLTIPGSVKTIKNSAFKGFNCLNTVVLSEGVEEIEANAFDNTNVADITIPQSLKKIGSWAFPWADGSVEKSVRISDLKKWSLIEFEESNSNPLNWATLYLNGNVVEDLTIDWEFNPYAFYGCLSIKSVTLTGNVTNVPDSAFANCRYLETISLPAGLKTIGSNAFTNADIEEVTIPNTVEYIGGSAFAYTSLKRVAIPNSVKNMGGSVFNGCNNLTSATIGTGLSEIPYGTFESCSNLKNIVIPANIKKIDGFGYSGIEDITILGADVEIASTAFYRTPLTNFNVEGNISKIDEYAFVYSDIAELSLKGNVTEIAYGAFAGCSNLAEIEIPDTVMSLCGTAFRNSLWEKNQPNGAIYLNHALYGYKGSAPANERFIIKNGTTVIAHYALESVSGITSVTLPEGLKVIGDYAFHDTDITEITIPASVEKIGNRAFIACESLKAINVDENNQYYKSVNGVLYNKDMTELIYCPNIGGNYLEIPESVEIVRSYAFGTTSVDTIKVLSNETEFESKAIGYNWDVDPYNVDFKEYAKIICGEISKAYDYAVSQHIGVVVEAEHVYDNDFDAECNGCGHLREVASSGWLFKDGKWYYYRNNGSLGKNLWVKDSVGWVYVGKEGYMITNEWVTALYGGWSYMGADGYAVKNQWLLIGGKWYNFDAEGIMVHNKWVKDSGGWLFLGSDGTIQTNAWLRDSYGYCYVGADGYCVTNKWMMSDDGWSYLGADGYMTLNSWVKDSKGWVYLNNYGVMKTNDWVKDSVGWCYVGSDGYVTKAQWVIYKSEWYFVDANGYMVSDKWMKDSKGWVYLGTNGAMKMNAWVKDSNGWCFVGWSGYCVTSQWKQDSTNKWCYLNANGNMVVNNWVNDGGKWYFMDASGYMISNTSKYWNGKTYYFNASGVCTNP